MGPAARRLLVDSWQRRGTTAFLLWPLSLIYGALVRLRRRLYRAGIWRIERVPACVIVVGNVVAGGGGKTPVVMALVRHLQSCGLTAGVVSRGYGRADDACREVRDDSPMSEAGDEPLLIKRDTGAPVFVARRRIDAARALLSSYPEVDVVVCDDGLQHYGLHRDLEICVFDAGGIANGLLLPAGPLREPWPRPCDLVLVTEYRGGETGYTLQRSLASHALRSDGSRVALEVLAAMGQAEHSLCAVAGIAHPEQFFAMLRDRGLALARTVALDDHADYDSVAWSKLDNEYTLVCTEKDAFKLWRFRPDALAIPLVLAFEDSFWDAFDRLLKQRRSAKLSSTHGYTPP